MFLHVLFRFYILIRLGSSALLSTHHLFAHYTPTSCGHLLGGSYLMRTHWDNFADVTLWHDYCTVDIKRLLERSSVSQCSNTGHDEETSKNLRNILQEIKLIENIFHLIMFILCWGSKESSCTVYTNVCETERQVSVSPKTKLWEQNCENVACDSSLCLNVEEWSHV